MLTCFQVFEMMLLAVQKILGRANIDMLIVAIDNGINARSRGDSIAIEVKWGYNVHTEETNPFFRHAPGCYQHRRGTTNFTSSIPSIGC